jgi:peptidyl-prolyl cis-trans isomerase SurA
MRKIFFCLLSGALVVLPGLPALSANTVIEEIVARVNNRIITRSDYQRSEQEMKRELEQQDPADAGKLYQEKKKDVLRDLIDQQLLLEKGTDLGITADTDVIKYLDNMRKQLKLDSMEALQKEAEAQGVNWEDFKQSKRNQIITQKVIGREVGQRLSITHEEEQKFYDEHKSELKHPEQIRLSELLVSTEKPGTPGQEDSAQQLAAAKAKANDLLAQIRKGASFEDIAKKNSDGPTAAQGGDLGYFHRGTLAKELEEKTFAMKPGDVSDVIRTKQGFVILKVTEHQKAGIPPLKDIEPHVQDALYMQKLQPALRDYLTKLREDAFIDIKSGYEDTGASPNETKPIETASSNAKTKKLQKKKKTFLLV